MTAAGDSECSQSLAKIAATHLHDVTHRGTANDAGSRNKKPRDCGALYLPISIWLFGGEGGIRTLDTLLTYTHFPGVLLQPLGHLTLFFDKRSIRVSDCLHCVYQQLSGWVGARKKSAHCIASTAQTQAGPVVITKGGFGPVSKKGPDLESGPKYHAQSEQQPKNRQALSAKRVLSSSSCASFSQPSTSGWFSSVCMYDCARSVISAP